VFSFQLVQLPNPLLEVHLSKDLAQSLQLTPLTTLASSPAAAAADAAGSSSSTSRQVSVARVRAQLSHQAGIWRLDPLPGGTKSEAVAASLQLQQEGSSEMQWGTVELTKLLGDLQVRLSIRPTECTATWETVQHQVIKKSTSEPYNSLQVK
jgi:hypothetical protein